MPGFLGNTRRRIREGADPEILARIAGRDGGAIVQGDITGSGIDIYVYKLNGTTAIHSATGLDPNTGSPTSGQIIFDTLQTDGRWDADTVGYNFRYPIRHEDFSAGVTLEAGEIYSVEAVVHTTDWGKIIHVWNYEVVPRYSG